ncbi:MAG: CHAD domain-containing protein, partial [Blastocatellia bacterium]
MEGAEGDDQPQAEAGEQISDAAGAEQVESPVRGLKNRINHYLHSLRANHSTALETGDTEAIHKIRVSTRRLQAAVDLLQTGSNELRARAVKRRLRKLRLSLANVRNYDVFIAMVEQAAAGRRPSIQRYQNELVTAELHKRRARSLLRVKQGLSHAHLGDLSGKVREVCGIDRHSDNQNPVEAGSSPIAQADDDTLKRRTVDRLEQRLAELQHLAARVDTASTAETMHRLRIAAKRLRYLLELVSEMGYGDSRRTVEWLKLLQDRLGDLHDIDAFQEEVVDIVSRPKFLKNHMIESGGMLYAAARVVGGRESLCARTFPVRIPLSVGAATRKLARAISKAGLTQAMAPP